jgi:hypothetical protein
MSELSNPASAGRRPTNAGLKAGGSHANSSNRPGAETALVDRIHKRHILRNQANGLNYEPRRRRRQPVF